MDNRKLLNNTTQEEKKLIAMVLERARDKLRAQASRPTAIKQQKRSERHMISHLPSHSKVGGSRNG